MGPKSRSIQESGKSKSEVRRRKRSGHDDIDAQPNGQRKQSQEAGRLIKTQAPGCNQDMLATQASQAAKPASTTAKKSRSE